MLFKYTVLTSLALIPVFAGLSAADAPVVKDARIDAGTVYVTISHPDTGWEHYADGWEVLDAQGNRLGFRELGHPHVNEQPFTRSLSGIELPAHTDVIYIRTRGNVDGWSEATFEVKVPQ